MSFAEDLEFITDLLNFHSASDAKVLEVYDPLSKIPTSLSNMSGVVQNRSDMPGNLAELFSFLGGN